MHELVGGRYRLEALIGNGGMAEVWRATDVRTGMTVALKRLHPRLALDALSQARFGRELEAARAVDHPSAVRILDAGDGPDGAWLAMEYLAGGSLADRLGAGPMSAEAVAAIGADVAGALAAVHAAGLIHRDVKPSNILLDADGAARLGDFGIARGDASGAPDDVTATGDVVGTLRFLPPEVLAGGPATAAADVWALGAVLYEALAGRAPFDASSPAALVASQRSMPARMTPVGDPLGDVLEAMLDPEPRARPTADDAAHALRASVPGPDPADDATAVIPAPAGIRAAPVRPVATAQRVAPRARSGIVPAGVLVALLLAGGLVLAVNGPFAASPQGGDAASDAGVTSQAPASPTPSPTAEDGDRGAPSDKGDKGKGKGNDKPDKPGKGNGG